MNNTVAAKLNPWLTIWTKPRATTRQVVEGGGLLLPILFAVILGCGLEVICSAWAWPGLKENPLPLRALFISAAIYGPLEGVGYLFLGSSFLFSSGIALRSPRRFQSPSIDSYFRSIFIAMGWALLPLLAVVGFWLLDFALVGRDMFLTDMPIAEGSRLVWWFVILTLRVSVILFGWYVVIVVNGIAEVQGFSIWKAIVNAIAAVLGLIIVLALLGLVRNSVLFRTSAQEPPSSLPNSSRTSPLLTPL